jgi:hypothetical protein
LVAAADRPRAVDAHAPERGPAIGRGERAATLAAFALLAALLSIHIDAPWRFIHDDNGAWTQAVATAHLKVGLSRTKGQDFLLRRADGTLAPYLHHPPLYPLIVAAAYRVTGHSGETATRLISAFFHLLSFAGLVALSRLVDRGASRPDAARRVLALAAFAVVPMSAFFGKMPFNEPVGLCGVIWAVVYIARYRAQPTRRVLAAACALSALACLTSWPAYAILGALTALFGAEALCGRRDRLALALALGATGAAAGALAIAQLAWASGDGALGLFDAGGHWGIHRLGPERALRAIGRAFDFHRIYFANVPFALFLVWCGARLWAAARRRAPIDERTRLLAAGALGAALWSIAFVRQVALHGYGQFWFLPFESMAAAHVVVEGWARCERRPRLRLALAALAVAGTLVSSAGTLHYRYSKPHGYAVRTAREIAETFETQPD